MNASGAVRRQALHSRCAATASSAATVGGCSAATPPWLMGQHVSNGRNIVKHCRRKQLVVVHALLPNCEHNI